MHETSQPDSEPKPPPSLVKRQFSIWNILLFTTFVALGLAIFLPIYRNWTDSVWMRLLVSEILVLTVCAFTIWFQYSQLKRAEAKAGAPQGKLISETAWKARCNKQRWPYIRLGLTIVGLLCFGVIGINDQSGFMALGFSLNSFSVSLAIWNQVQSLLGIADQFRERGMLLWGNFHRWDALKIELQPNGELVSRSGDANSVEYKTVSVRLKKVYPSLKFYATEDVAQQLLARWEAETDSAKEAPQAAVG